MSDPKTEPYGQSAEHYFSKAWAPFPVKGKSEAIPRGVTGRDGKDPGWDQIQEWKTKRPFSNVAVRANGWISIDVDAGGQEALDAAQEALGALPATWSSTSWGPDSERRQYFYRVPVGFDATLSEGRFRKRFGAHVDIIHRGHRYSVVYPSVHPDNGQQYRWYSPDGLWAERRCPNRTEDLAVLPVDWQAFIQAGGTASEDEDGFYDPAEAATGGWTEAAARAEVARMLDRVRTVDTNINTQAGGAMREVGRFVPAVLSQDDAVALCRDALLENPAHSDAWNVANGRKWTAASLAATSVTNGMEEPRTLAAPGEETATGGKLRQEILSAADSAYWLQEALGTGPLSGFFARGGRVVHTPLVDQTGYVAAPGHDDDNGPAQIQAVSAGQLAAKIQFAYRWFKTLKSKDEEPGAEVPALFPMQAAQRAVDAPESMPMLRPLAGITLTPMVRADGTILDTPGYDAASRYLFLPGPGVKVAGVPSQPTDEDVDAAVGLLDMMLAEFPWDTKDDRANYIGMLLTPMLRLITPPSYKMFGISAHQPGSGKTLLADIATAIHGGVLRSEAPEDETEWRKQITAILSTTSAPVIHIDNVTGVLKSSTLAGTLTAGQPVTDRELGSGRMITTVNDRTWILTGNNLSLGGDLVRRTVTIMIDPDQANPESREFTIPDLKAWVREHSNEIRRALLVMIRYWVAQGRPEVARAQSDSFAAWERAIGGILATCRVEGDFDRASGQRAASGDDEGTAETLAHLRDRFEDRAWTVLEALDGAESADIGDFVVAGRDWLPGVVLDKLARSETAGRKSFGYWLRNRLGRWVTDADGRALVIREVSKTKHGMAWRIDVA